MTALLLAGLALADADARAKWVEAIDAAIDAGAPLLRPCVAYTHAVSATEADLLVLDVRWTGKKASVSPRWASMDETLMAQCLAREVRKLNLPPPPGGESAIVWIEIDNLVPGRAYRTSAIDPDPVRGAQSRLPLGYVREVVASVRRDWSKACVGPIVEKAGEDVGARVGLRLEVQSDGHLAVSPRVESLSTELQACIIEQVAKLELLPGFGDTAALRLDVSLTGSGGEYADEYKRWEETWNRRIVTGTGWLSPGSRLDPADPVHLLISAEDHYDAAAAEFVGCALRHDVAPRTRYEVAVRYTPGGGREAKALPEGQAADCLAEVARRLPVLDPAAPTDVRFTLEYLPDQKFLVLPPQASGVRVDWGPRAEGDNFRALVVGGAPYDPLRPMLRGPQAAIKACVALPPTLTPTHDELLVDARFHGPTGAATAATLLLSEAPDDATPCIEAAARGASLGQAAGTGELRIVYTARVPSDD